MAIVDTHVKKIHEHPRKNFAEPSVFIEIPKSSAHPQPGPSKIPPNNKKSPKSEKSEDESLEMQTKNTALLYDDEVRNNDFLNLKYLATYQI